MFSERILAAYLGEKPRCQLDVNEINKDRGILANAWQMVRVLSYNCQGRRLK